MIHHYDTRWATYEPDGSTRLMTESEKAERRAPMPRYWVADSEVDRKLDAATMALPTFRNIARSTDERTFISALLPRVAIGHSAPIARSAHPRALQAAFTSFALDYALRQKLGGTNLTFNYVMQLPVPPADATLPGLQLDRRAASWVDLRVDRLNGWIADPTERAHVRAELDAYYFLLYGLEREDVDYIMETFPIVKRKDEAAFGEYRTKHLILAAYDAMSDAIRTGDQYVSPFTEVPA